MVESGEHFGTSTFSNTETKVKTLIILNFMNGEGALNYVEITVKRKMDFLPYKFDLIDSIITILALVADTLIKYSFKLGRKFLLSRHKKIHWLFFE